MNKFMFIIFLMTFMTANAQNILLNESTEKYEMVVDVAAKSNNQNENFDNVEEWLVTNYTNKYSSSKLTNKEKGKIIYSAAFETKIFPSKGLISYNYTIKVDKNKINFYITDFAYTIIGQTLSAGVAMNFESKGLAGKKKIIKETETKILEVLSKLML